jgi:sporulation protein YlmC with PRC-barrel domain
MTKDNANIASVGAGSNPNRVELGNLVGSSVQNHLGEHLGQIKDIILDVPSGRVSYVVLLFGGGLFNMRKKLFAVPWDAIRFKHKGGPVVLPVEKDCFRRTPGFDKCHWPSAVDESSWWQQMQPHY